MNYFKTFFFFTVAIFIQNSIVFASTHLSFEQKGLIASLKGYRTSDVNSGKIKTSEGEFSIKKGVEVVENESSISVSFCKYNEECLTVDFSEIISFSYTYTSYGRSQDYFLDPRMPGWGSNSEDPTYHKIINYNR